MNALDLLATDLSDMYLDARESGLGIRASFACVMDYATDLPSDSRFGSWIVAEACDNVERLMPLDRILAEMIREARKAEILLQQLRG